MVDAILTPTREPSLLSSQIQHGPGHLRTQPPPGFIEPLIAVFRAHELGFATKVVKEALDSNGVLSVLRDGLAKLGFHVEQSKYKAGKIERPVFYGENGVPTLRYQIDAYHEEWRCGLEVEAGRA